MTKLFLTGLFTLGMLISVNTHAPLGIDLAANAFADDDIEKKAKETEQKSEESHQKSELAQLNVDEAEKKAKEAAEKAKELDTDEAKQEAEDALKEAKEAEETLKAAKEQEEKDAQAAAEAMAVATTLHCPAGVATCYHADGSEYQDINNLPASAAGTDDDEETLATVMKPSRFRSF